MSEVIKKKGLSEMTRADFEAVTERSEAEDLTGFDSLVILPSRRMHYSGYRCMAFVVCKGDEALYKLCGGSDIIHIEGIGGYGYKCMERFNGVPHSTPPVGWNIDCLKTSGLLRLFTHYDLIADGGCYSSFELYSDPVKKKKP